jgi:IMP dehydrogenase
VRFLNDARSRYDLTYSDVFLVPSRSGVASRLDVDLAGDDGTGTTIPVVVANMTAVAGRRMAETVARRGGLAVLPQDVPMDVVADVISRVKASHPVFETALTLLPDDTVHDALHLLPKRAFGAIVVVDADQHPIGVVTEADCRGVDRFTQLHEVMSPEPLILEADVVDSDPGRGLAAAFDLLQGARRKLAPVVRDGRLAGVLTRVGAMRSTLYRPAVDADGRLRVGAAIGINGTSRPRPRRWSRPGPTASSWTPRTATRSGCSRRCGWSARPIRACLWSRATWSPPKACATWWPRAPTSSRSGSARVRCAPPG